MLEWKSRLLLLLALAGILAASSGYIGGLVHINFGW
jgi:hypothetical protein